MLYYRPNIYPGPGLNLSVLAGIEKYRQDHDVDTCFHTPGYKSCHSAYINRKENSIWT